MTCNNSKNLCSDKLGCYPNICPDFIIKRHDTRPALEVTVNDCGEPIDLTDTVAEISMWAKAKFKANVNKEDSYFRLADDIGFEQSLVGDIIVVEKIRSAEQMLITGFDEENKLIQVQRGYNGTPIYGYSKGTSLKIFRILNSIGSTEMDLVDVEKVDGTVEEDVISASRVIYEWKAQDTCLPGCYYLEIKLVKMIAENDEDSDDAMSMVLENPSNISFVTPSAASLGCELGLGVEWVRRFPYDKEGFIIKIQDSPTSESLI